MNTEETATQSAPVVETAQPAAPSPGTIIREARQAQRLSVDDLAAHTKLARSTVEALERDDFGALLEPVYVRGYYRKCAKVLALDEKKLIDAYASRVVQKLPQAPAKLRLASGTELGSSSRLPMAMAIVFVIVAVVVCAFLWWVRGATTGMPVPVPSAGGGGTPPAARTPAAEVIAPPTTDITPAPGDASTPPAATDGAMPPVPPPDANAAPLPPASDDAATAAPAASAAVPAAASAAGSAVPAAAGTGPLRLVFKGQSWVRVSDADGTSLMNGLISAGTRRRFDGKPPFEVFIGNAPAVGVEFDGKPVDLAPYTRDNATARLTLPAATP